jgi:Flp pilus assembly pilin Flp
LKGESGLTSAEYAVSIALVIVMTIAAITMLKGKSQRAATEQQQAVTMTYEALP